VIVADLLRNSETWLVDEGLATALYRSAIATPESWTTSCFGKLPWPVSQYKNGQSQAARREITVSGRSFRRDGIVPFAVEIVTRDGDRPASRVQ
jgi:hypothetical protein